MDNKLMPRVFGWMFVGLLLTFLTGYYVSDHPFTAAKLMSGYTYVILAVVEIVLVLYLSVRVTKMSPTSAKICFIVYSVLSGLTFSSIFLVYELTSIIFVFLITAILFGVFSLIGMFTKLDLSKISTYLFIALIGVLLASIVNVFLRSSALYFGITIISVIVFVAMTAYDVQKIKRMSGTIPAENLPIYGALELYLDFINLFIRLLRLFGKEKD